MMALRARYDVSRPSCVGRLTSRATGFGDRAAKETPVLMGRGTDGGLGGRRRL